MIRYRLDELGWFQFEQLCQTLLKATLGLAVEAWGGSADLGRDCYCERPLELVKGQLSEAPIVFQAKFVESANAAGAKSDALLLKAVRAEAEVMRKKLISRQVRAIREYVLLTNAPVSPTLESLIKQIIQEVAQNCLVSVQRGTDVCCLLDQNPKIRIAYPQLLGVADLIDLTDEAVRRSLSKNIRERSSISLKVAHETAQVFVPTSIYEKARSALGRHHFVVLTGPPEMGKTSIARILGLAAYTSGYEYYECRSPNDYLQIIEQDKRDDEKQSKQIFIADDAFGSTEYDPSLASAWARDLEYILRTLDSKHLLIWTSRSAPLAAALERLHFEACADFPKPAEVFVSASTLSVEEKSLILYRHSKTAGLNERAKTIVKNNAEIIVSDSHFTPERIRRFVKMTLPQLADESLGALSKFTLRTRIISEIKDPTKRMRTSFSVLNAEQRQLLISMLDCESGSVAETSLDNARLRLFRSTKNTDTRLVAKELDGHFVVTSRSSADDLMIDWIHPSWRDLIIEHLSTHRVDRLEFLSNCSIYGVMLALSTAGGSAGERRTPFLHEKDDWSALESTIERLLDSAERGVVIYRLSTSLSYLAPLAVQTNNAELLNLLRKGLRCLSKSIDQIVDGVSAAVLENVCKLASTLGEPITFSIVHSVEAIARELSVSIENEFEDSARSEFSQLVDLAKILNKHNEQLLPEIAYPQRFESLFEDVLQLLQSSVSDVRDDLRWLDVSESSERQNEFANWLSSLEELSKQMISEELAENIQQKQNLLVKLINDLEEREKKAQEKTEEESDEYDDDDIISNYPKSSEPLRSVQKQPIRQLDVTHLFSDL